MNGSRVLILGVSYKKNSNDGRETPATPLIRGLLELGAEVRVHDDHLGEYELDDRITRVELTAEEAESADAVILVTDHDDVDYDLVLANADYIFDARRRLSGSQVETI